MEIYGLIMFRVAMFFLSSTLVLGSWLTQYELDLLSLNASHFAKNANFSNYTHRNCFIGRGHEVLGNAVSTWSKRSKCLYRSMVGRSIVDLSNHWGQLSVENFVDAILSRGFTSLHMIGDSVTIQFGHFLGCDLVRLGFDVKPCPRMSTLTDCNRFGGCEYVHSKNGLGVLMITSSRTSVPCVYMSCTPEMANKTMTSYFDKNVKRFIHANSRPLIVYNDGMHLGLHHAHLAVYIAENLLRLSKLTYETGNAAIMFRETSRQHFHYSINGLHTVGGNITHNTSSYCCTANVQYGGPYPSDAIVQEHLYALDPTWRKYLSWIRFHNASDSLRNLHLEMAKNGAIDCTHYMYTPGISTVLTSSLVEGLVSGLI